MVDKKHEKTEKSKSVAKSTVAMSIATLSSRITGLIRTWVMAFALGNTVITSAYQVANNMPNAIFDLVAGGILGAAFIPIFMQEKQLHGKKGGNDFSCNILNLVIVIMGILSIVAMIFAPQVIDTQTFTVGDSCVRDKAIMFFRIFAFQILFYGISAVLTGILNGERVYFMPAFAPAINNIVTIITFIVFLLMAVYGFDNDIALIVLGIGTTLGVAVQALMQLPSLFKTGFKWKPIFKLKDPALFAAIKIAIPTFIYVIGMLVAFSCRNAFSLEISENGPSTLLYAWTWFQLPYGIIAVSLSRTMFTEMSESTAKEDMTKLRKQVNFGISNTLTLIIPLAVMMFTFATPIVSLFKAGSFKADDVTTVSQVLQFWVISLPFYSVVMYLYNVFAAIKKFTIFAVVSTVAVIGQCFCYWYFCTQISYFEILGIPAADFIFYIANCIVLIIILTTKIGNIRILGIVWTNLRVLIASLISGAVGMYFVKNFDFGNISMQNGIFQLCVYGTICLLIICILCWTFRVPLVVNSTKKIKEKIGRRICKK